MTITTMNLAELGQVTGGTSWPSVVVSGAIGGTFGMVTGAVSGAVAGAVVGGPVGAGVGAIVGATTGFVSLGGAAGAHDYWSQNRYR